MRRSLAAAAAIALVLTLAVAPAASAASPGTTTQVSSEWTWENTGATFTDLPDGSILFAGTEAGVFTGTFRGTSYDVFEITWFPPTTDPEHWGAALATGPSLELSGALPSARLPLSSRDGSVASTAR
jgi:hypothetical protein